MFYIIDTESNNVVAALSDVSNYSLQTGYIVREDDLGNEIEKLVFDPDTDSLRLLTEEEYLQFLRDAKESEFKSTVQMEFNELGDIIADLVKGIKLMIKHQISQDPVQRRELADFLYLVLQDLEFIYPDDYSRQCVAAYSRDLKEKLYQYYVAKMQVDYATSEEVIESIQLTYEE